MVIKCSENFVNMSRIFSPQNDGCEVRRERACSAASLSLSAAASCSAAVARSVALLSCAAVASAEHRALEMGWRAMMTIGKKYFNRVLLQ